MGEAAVLRDLIEPAGIRDSRSYLLAQECVTGPSRALGNPIRAPSSPFQLRYEHRKHAGWGCWRSIGRILRLGAWALLRAVD